MFKCGTDHISDFYIWMYLKIADLDQNRSLQVYTSLAVFNK